MKNFNTYKDLIDFIEKSTFSYILKIDKDEDEYYIEDEYVIGGKCGYSCYHSCTDDEDIDYHDVSPEDVNFENINIFLKLIFDDSEFDNEFDNVLNHFIYENEYDGNSDYYGNYYTYAVNKLYLKNYYNSKLSLKQMRLKKLNRMNNEE